MTFEAMKQALDRMTNDAIRSLPGNELREAARLCKDPDQLERLVREIRRRAAVTP